ncbi:MAG: hypothetical protein AAGF24_09775, partial [Cyanobacteria bacterium P01_H01_bin.121]
MTMESWLTVTPCCDRSTSLQAIAAQFQRSRTTELIVLDTDQKPLGILRLHKFLSYWVNLEPDLQTQTLQNLPREHQLVEPIAIAVLEQSLTTASLTPPSDYSSIAVPGQANWLQEYLTTDLGDPLVFSDQQGRYLGTLNPLSLLPVLQSDVSAAGPTPQTADLDSAVRQQPATAGSQTAAPQRNAQPEAQPTETNSVYQTHLGHAVRTLLTSVLGLVSLLRQHNLATPPVAAQPHNDRFYIDLLHTSTRRLSVALSDWLTWLQLGVARPQPYCSAVTFEQSCHQALALAQRQLVAQELPNLDLKTFELPHDWLIWNGDRQILEQVLVQLLLFSHSIQPQPPAHGLKLTAWGPAWLSLTLWHTGSGLSEAEQKRWSTPIDRTQITTIWQHYSSPDLKLLIAQQLVAAHGGVLSWQSYPEA